MNETISRRTFNKTSLLAAIAGITSPAVASATAACPPIPWELFCDPENTRYSLGQPFIQDGIKFATDSAIMIWSPTSEPDTDCADRKIPDARSVLRMVLDSDDLWRPWPEPSYCSGDNLCENECWCYGGRTRKTQCNKCDGAGDSIAECVTCNGDGMVYFGPPCQHCNGTGTIDRLFQISDGLIIDRMYDVRIRQLSDTIEWRTSTVHENRYGRNQCIAFRWPRGLGAVMSMTIREN